MPVSLKKTHPHVKEVASGTVSLLQDSSITQPSVKPGSVVRRVLACYTGVFDGMYGEVAVTPEILQGLADRYNSEKENVPNENAYAPILTDHIREVDRIKGRLLAGLTVEPWVNPSSSEEALGLYGWMRIDDAEAIQKVELGQYAHVSISFDEESFELFEISFVAVEAARGAMVLSKKNSLGGKMELSKKYASLSQKHKALAAGVKAARKRRALGLKKIQERKEEIIKDVAALSQRMTALKMKFKTSQLSAQMKGFVRQGKMNPAELSKLDIASLAALPGEALTHVLASYEARPVSTDVFQYGQTGAALGLTGEPKTKEEMAKAVAAQLAARGKTALAGERVAEDKPVDSKKAKLEGEEPEPAHKKAIDADDLKDTLAEMDDLHGKMGDAMDKMKSLGEEADKITDGDKKDEEREMGEADDGDDLAAADDDDDKKKKEEK